MQFEVDCAKPHQSHSIKSPAWKMPILNYFAVVKATNKIYGSPWKEKSVARILLLSFDHYESHKQYAHYHLHVALLITRNGTSELFFLFCASSLLRNKSSNKLITFLASQDLILNLILDYCASKLNTPCMPVSRIDSEIET